MTKCHEKTLSYVCSGSSEEKSLLISDDWRRVFCYFLGRSEENGFERWMRFQEALMETNQWQLKAYVV